MKKKLFSVLSLALALVLPSCLEVETEITLKKDGSGTITEEMVMGAQMIGMMEMAAAQGGQQKNPLTEMKDEAKLKEKAKEYGEGVTFAKVEEIKRDNGGKGVRVTYNFTDINKIKISPAGGMDQLSGLKPGGASGAEVEEAEKAAAEAMATFTYADGKLTINLPQPEAGEDAGTPEEGGEEGGAEIDPQMAMMAEMMKGMKIGAKVTVAPGIAKTNATHHKDNTITLFELDFDEVMKNPGGLNALNGIDQNNPAEALKAIKGAKAETKGKITATVK